MIKFITITTAIDTFLINPAQVNSLKATPLGVQVGLGARLLILPNVTVEAFLELINGSVQPATQSVSQDIRTV